MSLADFLGHIGYMSIVAGTLLIARRDIRGWWPRMAGDTLVAAMGVMLGVSSIWLWGSIFLIIDIVGYRKWKKQGDIACQKRKVGYPGSGLGGFRPHPG